MKRLVRIVYSLVGLCCMLTLALVGICIACVINLGDWAGFKWGREG